MLIDYKLALGTDRDAAIALSGSVAGIVERRKPLGDALRGRIAKILSAANPALREDEAAAAAVIVNQVMKMIPALAATEDERAASARRRSAEAHGALHRRGLRKATLTATSPLSRRNCR